MSSLSAMLSGAQGGAFAICGVEILILHKITSADTPPPYYTLNLPNLVLFIVGVLLVVLHCVLRRVHGSDSQGVGCIIAERNSSWSMVVTLRSKIFLLLVLMFVGFVNIIIFQTYNRLVLQI